jgi:glycosyltransferase involved in cell wall biosynthesis
MTVDDVQREDVVVSNGFNRFHLAVAAAELAAAERLALLITGAYPTPLLERIWTTALLRSRRARRVRERINERGVDVPNERIRSAPLAEIAAVAGARLGRDTGVIDAMAWNAYAHHAAKCLRQLRAPVNIYHFRSGFGRSSIGAAREMGAVSVCDHSIAHPGALAHLVRSQGTLPDGSVVANGRQWRAVLDDITRADVVLVNSEFVRATFVSQGWDPERLRVIYWGIDDAFLANLPRRAKAVVDGSRSIFFAGAVDSRKGADVLLDAFEMLASPTTRLALAGPVAPALRDRVKRAVRNNPQIEVLGARSRREIASRMAASDIFVLPTLAEGSARVVFEALAAGCYVVTTPNAGSVVGTHAEGTLVSAGDAAALATGLEAALRRSDLASIGQENSSVVRAQFGQRQYRERLIRLYSELLDR